MHSPILFTDSGKPLYRIAGGSEPSFQDQVAAEMEKIKAAETADSGPPETPAPETETTEESGGLSGFAKDFLSKAPAEHQEVLKTYLPEWDKNVQKKIRDDQDLQSKYKPWEEFVTNGYEPDYLKQAAALAQLIENDPQKVYEALVQQHGFGADQGVADQESESDETGSESDGELRQMVESMAQILLAQKAQQEEKETEAQLDAYMNWLHETSGDFDDEYVLTAIGQGLDGVEAVKRWNDIVEKAVEAKVSAKKPAPPILGGAGGLPSQEVDPGSLSEQDMKSTVAALLMQAQAANNGGG